MTGSTENTPVSKDGMTPAERVLAAFQKRRIDRIAIYHSGFSSRVASALLGREAYTGGGINQWRETQALWEGPDAHAEFEARAIQDARDLARIAHTDMVRIAYWRLPVTPARRIDRYTYLYGNPEGDYEVMRLDPMTELYQVVQQRKSDAPRTADDLERVVLEEERRLESFHPTEEDFRDILDAMAYFGPEYAVPSHGYNLAVPNRDLLWLEAVALRPDLVAKLLDCQCTRSCRLIEAQKDLPGLYLMGGGDFCGNNGPNYSPKAFHDLMLPRLQRMSAEAHRCGKYTIFATDGNVWQVADDLFGASGTDAFHEIDRLAGMDLRDLRKRFPDLTCFGNISTITLHRGTQEQVAVECRDNAEAALELGGILCGVSNQVPPLVPIENVVTMIETLEEYH